MTLPVLFAVDEDEEALRAVERELVDRYEKSYRVVCAGSAEDAVAELSALADAGEEVALALAAPQLSGAAGSDLLGDLRELHPHAQRGLLIEWGSWGDGSTAEMIFRAMARRHIEYYVIRPSRTPDELFHQSISTFLLEWAHAKRVSPHTVHVIGESWTGRAFELRQVFGPLRGAARLRAGRFSRWAGAGRRGGGRFGPAAGHLPERHDPGGPEQPRAGERRGSHDRLRAVGISTSSSSAPARPACRPPSTAPPRACGRSWSTTAASEGRRPRAR